VQPILNFLIIKFVLLENIVPTNEPPPGLPWGSLEGFLFLVLRVIPCAPVWMGLVFRWAFCFLFLFSFVFCLPMGHSPVFLCSNSPCPHCLQFLPLDVFQPSLYEPCIYLFDVQCMLGRCREIGRRICYYFCYLCHLYIWLKFWDILLILLNSFFKSGFEKWAVTVLVLLPTRYQRLPVLFSCKHGSSLEQLKHIQWSFCFFSRQCGSSWDGSSQSAGR